MATAGLAALALGLLLLLWARLETLLSLRAYRKIGLLSLETLLSLRA